MGRCELVFSDFRVTPIRCPAHKPNATTPWEGAAMKVRTPAERLATSCRGCTDRRGAMVARHRRRRATFSLLIAAVTGSILSAQVTRGPSGPTSDPLSTRIGAFKAQRGKHFDPTCVDAFLADREGKGANRRVKRDQTVVGVVLDYQGAAGLYIGEQCRVGGAHPRIAVECAHTGDHGIEIGKGGSALARRRVRQYRVADDRHLVAGLP